MAKMNKSPSKCLFFGSIFFVLHVLTQADPPYNLCSSSPNFAVNSPFQSNLNNLLNNLQSNASISSFNYTTVGKDEDRIYGNFLCLLNVSPQDCQTCVKTAGQNIQKFCPSSKEAITWEENCQIRYSNRSFFGVLDKTGYEPLFNMKNISDPEKFTTTVKDLMGKLTEKAVSGNSTKMVATGQSNYSSIETLYGLVQCTPDLSQNDCKNCLQTATNEILSCCYFYRGARVLLRSCYLRYEMYPFNEVKSSSPTQTASTPSTRARLSTALIVVILIVFIGVFVIGGISCYCFVKKRRLEADRSDLSNHIDSLHSVLSHRSQHGENQINPQELIRFVDILRATNHFSDSNKLGEGGFGPVYKGRLPDGREVAIKRLSSNSEQGSEEFMNEVLLIMKLQHKNLVRLIGCCTEREERILVYEYMPNSSLDVLLAPSRRRHLDWRKRVSIIIGIARGLLYLHQDSRLKIIHRDLKASNVLLGSDLNPKISDFGMARIFLGNLGEASTNRIVGTYGYMAPEYAMEGAYSTKIDVYSFGVLLFEIITGKKSVGFHLSQIAPSLVAYVWRLWSEGYGLELKDQLLVEFDKVEFLRCIQIGLLCVQEDPAVRPNMSSVVVMLGSKSLVLPQPQQPAGLAARVGNKAEKCNKNSVNGLTISTITPR